MAASRSLAARSRTSSSAGGVRLCGARFLSARKRTFSWAVMPGRAVVWQATPSRMSASSMPYSGRGSSSAIGPWMRIGSARSTSSGKRPCSIARASGGPPARGGRGRDRGRRCGPCRGRGRWRSARAMASAFDRKTWSRRPRGGLRRPLANEKVSSLGATHDLVGSLTRGSHCRRQSPLGAHLVARRGGGRGGGRWPGRPRRPR